jgi:hypothetical protein
MSTFTMPAILFDTQGRQLGNSRVTIILAKGGMQRTWTGSLRCPDGLHLDGGAARYVMKLADGRSGTFAILRSGGLYATFTGIGDLV